MEDEALPLRSATHAHHRAGSSSGTATTTAAFPAGPWTAPPCRICWLDIGKGEVDLVVVYKVDRLTRSLTDFARIIETFDARGVSFVSVTQQFNTANSMGPQSGYRKGPPETLACFRRFCLCSRVSTRL